jgi:hypothetical protein
MVWCEFSKGVLALRPACHSGERDLRVACLVIRA